MTKEEIQQKTIEALEIINTIAHIGGNTQHLKIEIREWAFKEIVNIRNLLTNWIDLNKPQDANVPCACGNCRRMKFDSRWPGLRIGEMCMGKEYLDCKQITQIIQLTEKCDWLKGLLTQVYHSGMNDYLKVEISKVIQ